MLLQAPGLLFIHALAELSQLSQQRCIVRGGRDRITQGTEAQQQIALGTATLQHLLQHSQPWRHTAVLTHQFEPQPGGAAPLSAAKGLKAGQNLQQRGLPRSVRADQAKAIAFRDMEIQIGEEGADAEVLGGTHQADQAHNGRVDS